MNTAESHYWLLRGRTQKNMSGNASISCASDTRYSGDYYKTRYWIHETHVTTVDTCLAYYAELSINGDVCDREGRRLIRAAVEHVWEVYRALFFLFAFGVLRKSRVIRDSRCLRVYNKLQRFKFKTSNKVVYLLLYIPTNSSTHTVIQGCFN